MVVHGRLFDAPGLEGAHDGTDFLLREDEISHRHRLALPDLLERCPRAECERRLDGHAVGGHREVAARKAESQDLAWLRGALPPERFLDARKGRRTLCTHLATVGGREDGGCQERQESRSEGLHGTPWMKVVAYERRQPRIA